MAGYFRKPIPFCGGKQLRLVLYQECDIRGRDLLFDSNCFEEFRVEQEQSPSEASGRSEPRCVSTKSSYTNTTAFNIIEICDGIVYKVLFILSPQEITTILKKFIFHIL